MLSIKNHLFYINGIQVDYKPSPNTGGVLIPKYLIMHYDGASNETSAINWMTSKTSNVSAHLHISRLGHVTQLVPFNMVAWHCGASEWDGLKGLNKYSIGIELQNDGKQAYTDVQILVASEVTSQLVNSYSLSDILGHSDIAPGRKIDPGKHFPMKEFKVSAMALKCFHKEVVSNLNIRSGPGTQYAVMEVLPKGTIVEVIIDQNGWSHVEVNDKLMGWVSSKYLK